MNKEKQLVDGGFLQSECWRKFQKSIGRKIVQIKKDAGNALMIFHKLPIVGGYFFIPRGPLFKCPITNNRYSKNIQYPIFNIQTLLYKIIEVAKKENVGWVRLEPQTEGCLELIKKSLEGKYKIVKSKKNHEPAQTIMLDLEKSEEELLAQMKQKTRYNIRLSSRKGVEVFQSREEREVGKFIELTKETAKRDGIVPHPDEYYKKMIETISSKHLKLYFAKFKGKTISSIMVSFYGGVATYLHGASGDEHRNVMAPFALQWQAIKDAKKMGCEKYDFGGTRLSKENEKWTPQNGSWQGISKFKLGFCPNCQPVEFPGCWDIVIDPKRYWFYKFLQMTKDISKGKSNFFKKAS